MRTISLSSLLFRNLFYKSSSAGRSSFRSLKCHGLCDLEERCRHMVANFRSTLPRPNIIVCLEALLNKFHFHNYGKHPVLHLLLSQLVTFDKIYGLVHFSDRFGQEFMFDGLLCVHLRVSAKPTVEIQARTVY